MNILIQLSHPAHFHLYKNVAQRLLSDGHQVHVVIKTKDILEDLVRRSGIPYTNISPKVHRNSKFGILFDMLCREFKMIRICSKYKIDLLTGSTPEVAHVGWLLRKYRINVGADDMDVVPLFDKIAGPFVETIVSPISCDNGDLESKSIKYPGFQQLSYLHPNVFNPDKNIVEKYLPLDRPYFLIRFAKLDAHHDKGISGINDEIASKLIDILKPYGRVFITSERSLKPEFEQYRLNINPLDIHHVMAFASLYIGDSQSMTIEAAMLGVPSLRFNGFVGRIGVLEELQYKYRLTQGIKADEPSKLYDALKNLLATPNLHDEFQNRRKILLNEKIDVSAFLAKFIETYPKSILENHKN